VPEGVAENDLTIAYFDEEAGVWIELQGRVDTAASTVTARVPHFTTFAVVGSLRPAAFSIGNILISPDEAMPGDSITIVAEVTNTGGLEGTQSVTLEIDGVPEEAQDIVLAGGESRAVGFTVSKDTPGSYVARIGASTGGFSVVSSPHGLSGVVWAGGIGTAVVLAGLGAYLAVIRRRQALSR
jgi:hypothetical protein